MHPAEHRRTSSNGGTDGKVGGMLYDKRPHNDEGKSTTFSTMFGYFNYCLYLFISKEFGLEAWKKVVSGRKLTRKQIVMFEKPKHDIFDDVLTDKVLRYAASLLDLEFNVFLQKYGNYYFHFCSSKYGDILKSIATNLADFINNIDDIRRHIHKIEKIADDHPPSIYASVDRRGGILLYYYSYRDQKYLEHFIIGYLKAAALSLYDMHCEVRIQQERNDKEDFSIISIKAVNSLSRQPSFPFLQVSTQCEDLVVEPYIMDDIFPFHMILDQNLDMSQIGISLNRLVENYIPKHGLNIKNYFKLIKPAMKFCYKTIKNNLNTAFIFASHEGMFTESFSNGLVLKGQITYLASSGSLWFIASPKVDRLSQLNELSLSSIPLHDATREVLLISEQSHAQDTLKSQLQVLTNQLKETSKELALGKINTETILDEIFPKEVAYQLMQNKPVPAVTAEEVSILFTDIVGFTRICGECDPEDVTDMLNSLYLEFDVLCEKHEVYKVETIGDAYMAVGGIHRKDKEHGRSCTLMGIEMVERASTVSTPTGESIQIRVGVHSGSVVAGVVGTRMPRYCLFGNNVTLANKMESTSDARRVHISPATYLEIKHHQEFVFWYRKREVMPPLMQKLYQGNTFFVTQRRPTDFDDTRNESDRRLKYMKAKSIDNELSDHGDRCSRRNSLTGSVCSECQDYQKYPEALREQLHALEKINGYEIGKRFLSPDVA